MSAPAVSVLDRPTGVTPPPNGPLRRRLAGLVRAFVTLAVVAAIGAGGYFTHDRWLPVLFPVAKETVAEPDDLTDAAGPSEQILLSAQAQKNLRLTAKPLKAETFWKTISVPGIVIDRPGFSDRGLSLRSPGSSAASTRSRATPPGPARCCSPSSFSASPCT